MDSSDKDNEVFGKPRAYKSTSSSETIYVESQYSSGPIEYLTYYTNYLISGVKDLLF